MSEVPNLCFGMHHLTVTQLPKGDFSHPNLAMDLAGQDGGVDFWFAKCCDWKCIAGEWGSGTYFFIPCDSKGNHINIMCADGKQRKITIALTQGRSMPRISRCTKRVQRAKRPETTFTWRSLKGTKQQRPTIRS